MAIQNVRILPFINKYAYITSIFWEDRNGRPHRGVDLAVSGSAIPLYSMCEGRVIYRGYDANGFGNYIIMKDNTTHLGFLYAHLSRIDVSVNDSVSIGTQVGIQGRTGSATGNHLHLEMQDLSNRNWIYRGERSDYINPADWIQYTEILGDQLYYNGIPEPLRNKKRKGYPWVIYLTRWKYKKY